ncbi:DUF481 domain-containing protein [Paraflavisolibacter sp. H34]|uniref:DUF481 domain-containing protein n=1 Tax=Huijunlia imazamoxiresistens TaxID=3127457 RepID=UPI003018B50F
MNRVFCFLAAVVFSLTCSAQVVVNIESQRMPSDTTGWKGGMGTSFSFTRNIQQILNINANAHLQYKREKDLYLLVANYNLLKTFNQKLSNNMFYHLRYNRKVNEWLRWEAFNQWQQDVLANINLRVLAGTGPRFKVHDKPRLKLYAATLAMFEHEKEKTKPPVVHNDIRSSSYLSLTWKPTEQIQVVSTAFYQPLFRQLSDFRFLHQLNLNVKATKHFSITTAWNYLYDAAPAAGAPNINLSISNGFAYNF